MFLLDSLRTSLVTDAVEQNEKNLLKKLMHKVTRDKGREKEKDNGADTFDVQYRSADTSGAQVS